MILSEDPEENWRTVEALNNIKKQQNSLKEHLQAREPINRFSQINEGNHLVRKKSLCGRVLYYHHFLCVGSDSEGQPKIVHYYNTTINAVFRFIETESFKLGSGLGYFASIVEMTLPDKNFIESEDELQKEGAEVERVIWPEELKRYSTEEVIERAKQRMNEPYYSVAHNNCESFVMWCLCGLNISLQANPWVVGLAAVGDGTIKTLFQHCFQILKYVSEFFEKVRVSYPILGNAMEALSSLGSTLKMLFVRLWEIYNATCLTSQILQRVLEYILCMMFDLSWEMQCANLGNHLCCIQHLPSKKEVERWSAY